MYSFYGGRPGNSFIIIAAYESVADMVSKFKQGSNYTAVHYDEHVIINTENKNDPDNGKLYRRGYDFSNDMGGAEYIGTIVGPPGRASALEMTTIADVRSKAAEEGYKENRSSGEYSVVGDNLVPGKKNDGTFNDSIKWEACTISREDGNDSMAYIGFTFPYPVIDYETNQVEPYTNGRYADTSSAVRIDDGTHPFFEKWRINIPKGIKGNSFMNLTVQPASVNVQTYTGQQDDINNNRMIVTYNYYNYDDYQNGEPVKLYLGDYNMINNISVSDEGTMTIDYTHDNNLVLNKKIKWINSITLNTDTGLLTITYNHTTDANNNPTTYTTYLDWIKTVNVSDDGTVTFGRSHGSDVTFSKLIKWCTGVTINNSGTVTFSWNNGTSDTVLSNVIKWISNVQLGTNGTLTVSYNNGSPDSVFNLNWPVSMGVNTSISSTESMQGTGNQKLYINWANGAYQQIGEPINYVMEMAVNSANNHLLAYYSDPERRRYGNITYNGISGWTDIGEINAQTYDYNSGDSITMSTWTGNGIVDDDGTNTQKLSFTMSINGTINKNINNIIILGGRVITGSFNVSLQNNASISQTFGGLLFEVDTGVASSGSSSHRFSSTLVTNLRLRFE